MMSLVTEHLQLYRDFKDHVKIDRYIVVRGDYVGFHKYKDAPNQVAFLRNSHRHLFKWKVTIEVHHNDRELEFFMVKNLIETQIIPYFTLADDLGSCEMQAEKILEGLVNSYGPNRYYSVSVSEDGESDGLIEWRPLS